ncbi:MAG: PLP-dependent transferase [Hymenobacter sp.]
MRGLKTLRLRMRQHSENAMTVAQLPGRVARLWPRFSTPA